MGRIQLVLALCLIGACTTVPERRPGATASEHAAPAERPRHATETADAPAPSPPPKPLGPLREFTPEEWRRIRRVQRYVEHVSRRYALSASFINGMIWTESKFEARARGRRGPRGLLQLMPRTARAMAKRLKRKYMPHSADFNITAGVEYLMLMYERFDRDLHLALAAYNAGPAAVVRWKREGAQAPKPRVRYVEHVVRAARAFCVRLRKPRFEPDDSPFSCPPEAPVEISRVD